jgi:hypothetical protein
MQTAPQAPLLPLTETARLLRVPAARPRGEAESGRLPHLPHLPAGNTILFDADLVERLLAERARRPVTRKGGRGDE